MSIIASFAHWLEQRDWAMEFAGSAYFYPIVLATHLTCIGIFGGMILITNLRLLGWVLRSQSVTDMVGRLRPWKWGGLLLMVTCGALLAGSEAGKYYGNPYFWTKMTLLIAAIVHAIVFRGSVYKNTEALDRAPTLPAAAKVAGFTSILIWAGIACMGRLIAYYE